MAELMKLKEKMTCTLCQQILFNPKILPCEHMFCNSCLDDILVFRYDGSATLQCPNECTESFKVNSKLTISIILDSSVELQELLEMLKDTREQKEALCEEEVNCQDTVRHSCSTCLAKTCDSCWNQHTCEYKISTPIIFDQRYNSFKVICEEHDSYVKEVCIDCENKLLCAYCTNRYHKPHSREVIHDQDLSIEKLLSKQQMKTGKNVSNILSLEDASFLICKGRLDRFKLMLKRQPDIVHMKQKWHGTGDNLLHIAARAGKSETLSLLLVESHKHINDVNCRGYTALMLAARNGHALCVNVFIEHNADINIRNWNGGTALTYAASNGHLSCVEVLIKHKADPNIKDWLGITALMHATRKSHLSCLEFLIKHHVDLNTKNRDGDTALTLGTIHRRTSCVELLLKHNANVNIKNISGKTALMLATNNGDTSCIRVLVKYEADLNIRDDDDGKTALMHAANEDHLSCVEILLEHGADLDKRNYWGDTALMFAVKKGHVDCVKFLLENNANIRIGNYQGKTLYDFAKDRKIKKVLRHYRKSCLLQAVHRFFG